MNSEQHRALNQEQIEHTVQRSPVFSMFIAIAIAYYVYQDFYVFDDNDFLYLRLPCILSLLCILGAYLYKRPEHIKRKQKVIYFGHIFLMYSLLLQSILLLNFEIMKSSLDLVAVGSISGGVCITIFVVYIFSFGATRWIPWIASFSIFPAFIYIIFESVGRLDPEVFVLLSNPILSWMVMLVLVRSRLKRDESEFMSRWNLNKVNEKLNSEFEKVKVLNGKLEKEKESVDQLLEQLKDKASQDEMTGAFNRAAGLDILNKDLDFASRHNVELTLAFIDIDNLKKANDQFGHSFGDEIIRQISLAIKLKIRACDYFVRMGGDEFLIVFPKCNAKQAEMVIERIVKELRLLEKDNIEKLYSFSFGCASNKEEGLNDSIKLIEAADLKMYQDKQRKKYRAA